MVAEARGLKGKEKAAMLRKPLSLLIVAAVAGLVGVLSLSVIVFAQQAPSAERSFSPETVEPGGQVTVTINITNFQLGMAVVETLPDGFTYVSDSLSDGTIQVAGQDLQIIPGSADFTYEVSVSDTPGATHSEAQ